MKIIIAGGRDFTSYTLLRRSVNLFILELQAEGAFAPGEAIEIVSGTAMGADLLGEGYAKAAGYPVIRMPADWKTHGNSAGYKRNEAMAKIADAAICFWDRRSRGTGHMIDLARAYKLKLKIINYG